MVSQVASFCSSRRHRQNVSRGATISYKRKTISTVFGAKIVTQAAVCDFLEQDSSSRMCPGKKDCITKRGDKKQKKIAQ